MALSFLLLATSNPVPSQPQEIVNEVKVEVIDTVIVNKVFFVESKIKTKGLSLELLSALANCPYEGITITSGVRIWPKRSKHTKGQAVDIKLDEKLVNWLQTNEASEWLKKYNIKYIIEFTSHGSVYDRFKRNYRNVKVNRGATGAHIHLELK
jgi:hypothetical protein